MSLRTFTIFQDAPANEPSKAKPTNSSRIIRSSASNTENHSSATSLPAIDKENVHPVTGERTRPSFTDAVKKRKTSVLTTKVYVPLAPKSSKESKEREKLEKDSQPLAKKRKSSTATAKGSSSKKDVRPSGLTRKPVKLASRRDVSLPKLDEEPVDAEKALAKDRQRTSQVNVDSKCYDLTVKPLTDVSDVYEKISSVDDVFSDKIEFSSVKESSAEPEIRDYFSPPLTASTARVRSTSKEPQSGARGFSTPERKKIYAAFTFSSPSPISKRFKEIPITSHNASSTVDHA